MENQKIRVDLSQAPWVGCECGHNLFSSGIMFKKLSSILSPTGKEELIPVEVVICQKCQKVPSFIVKNIKDFPDVLKASSERIVPSVPKTERSSLFVG